MLHNGRLQSQAGVCRYYLDGGGDRTGSVHELDLNLRGRRFEVPGERGFIITLECCRWCQQRCLHCSSWSVQQQDHRLPRYCTPNESLLMRVLVGWVQLLAQLWPSRQAASLL